MSSGSAYDFEHISLFRTTRYCFRKSHQHERIPLMFILDAYTGYRVQLVKEQEKTQFYFSFKNPFKFTSRLIHDFI